MLTKRKSTSHAYDIFKSQFDKRGDNNVCGLISVCLLTGVSVDKVYSIFKKLGRVHKRAVSRVYIYRVLQELGYSMELVYARRTCDKRRAVKNISSLALELEGTHLVFSSGHVAAVTGEYVHDHASGVRKYITDIYQIRRVV